MGLHHEYGLSVPVAVTRYARSTWGLNEGTQEGCCGFSTSSSLQAGVLGSGQGLQDAHQAQSTPPGGHACSCFLCSLLLHLGCSREGQSLSQLFAPHPQPGRRSRPTLPTLTRTFIPPHLNLSPDLGGSACLLCPSSTLGRHQPSGCPICLLLSRPMGHHFGLPAF